MKIGEIMAADREITLNEGKKTVTVTVANKRRQTGSGRFSFSLL